MESFNSRKAVFLSMSPTRGSTHFQRQLPKILNKNIYNMSNSQLSCYYEKLSFRSKEQFLPQKPQRRVNVKTDVPLPTRRHSLVPTRAFRHLTELQSLEPPSKAEENPYENERSKSQETFVPIKRQTIEFELPQPAQNPKTRNNPQTVLKTKVFVVEANPQRGGKRLKRCLVAKEEVRPTRQNSCVTLKEIHTNGSVSQLDQTFWQNTH